MKKHRRRKKMEKKQPTLIGQIVDLPYEEFKEEIVRQQVNIGTINNLILNLESIYFELRNRKDAILKMKFESAVESVVAEDAIKGLYSEMLKVEYKITYLKQRRDELVDVDKTPN